MKKMHIIAIDSIFILAMLTGCSPTTSPAENVGLPPNVQNYQIEIINLTEPVYETIRTENIDQPNCNGTGDVDNVVERTMGINHSIELGLGLTVDIDGKLELFGTGVDLGAAISSELGYQYGITESISRSITVRAAPKTHVVHTVKLSEVWESGTARVISNGESIDIPFRFRANFSIDLLESVPVNCQTGQTDTIQPAIQPTVAPASTQISNVSAQASTSLLQHKSTPILGTGIFEQGTYSDGMFPISEAEISSHSNIQRIWLPGNPDGCAIAYIDSDKIWFGSSVKTDFTINDVVVGTINSPTGKHGYVFNATVHSGDKVCVSYFEPSGFHVIFGDDIYYHYDSYCYRGNC